MSPEAHHIRQAIRTYTIRRNTREICMLMAGIYIVCGLVAWAVFY